MPIPKPKKGEKEEDYHSRCMSAISDEYEQDQGNAICYSTWREHKKAEFIDLMRGISFVDFLKEFNSGTLPLASQPRLDAGNDAPRKKSSKAAAVYVNHPVNDHQCSECWMFQKPNSCTAVEGTISPEGHCKFWEAKDVTAKMAALHRFLRRTWDLSQILVRKAEGHGSGAIPDDQAMPISLPLADDETRAQIEHIAWETIRTKPEVLTSDDILEFAVAEVPISDIVATQDIIDRERVEQHAKDYEEKGKFDEDPICIKYDGKYYILDGHHRVEGAKEAGAKEIQINYIDGDKGDVKAFLRGAFFAGRLNGLVKSC